MPGQPIRCTINCQSAGQREGNQPMGQIMVKRRFFPISVALAVLCVFRPLRSLRHTVAAVAAVAAVAEEEEEEACVVGAEEGCTPATVVAAMHSTYGSGGPGHFQGYAGNNFSQHYGSGSQSNFIHSGNLNGSQGLHSQNFQSYHHPNGYNDWGHHDWDHGFQNRYWGAGWYGPWGWGWGWGWGFPYWLSYWGDYPFGWGGYWADYFCPYGSAYATPLSNDGQQLYLCRRRPVCGELRCHTFPRRPRPTILPTTYQRRQGVGQRGSSVLQRSPDCIRSWRLSQCITVGWPLGGRIATERQGPRVDFAIVVCLGRVSRCSGRRPMQPWPWGSPATGRNLYSYYQRRRQIHQAPSQAGKDRGRCAQLGTWAFPARGITI